MLPVKSIISRNPSLQQLTFMEIIRIPQILGKYDHLYYLQILPECKKTVFSFNPLLSPSTIATFFGLLGSAVALNFTSLAASQICIVKSYPVNPWISVLNLFQAECMPRFQFVNKSPNDHQVTAAVEALHTREWQKDEV